MTEEDINVKYTKYCIEKFENPCLIYPSPDGKYSVNGGTTFADCDEKSRNLARMGKYPWIYVSFEDGVLYVDYKEADFMLGGVYNQVMQRVHVAEGILMRRLTDFEVTRARELVELQNKLKTTSPPQTSTTTDD